MGKTLITLKALVLKMLLVTLNKWFKVYLPFLLLCVNSLASNYEYPVSIVRVNSTHSGYGILSSTQDNGIVILTNSHILKGKSKAKITLSFINHHIIDREWHIDDLPHDLTFSAESIQKTDDPVGDIILLKLKLEKISPALFTRILRTANRFVFCKISLDCPKGYILNDFNQNIERTLTHGDLYDSASIVNVLKADSPFYQRIGPQSEIPEIFRRDWLHIVSTINNKIDLIKPDNIIAAENSHSIALPTYGREGYSGSPVFSRSELIGLLTKVHLDGTPFAYAIPIEDIVKRIQYSLYNGSDFKPKIQGYWSKKGSLIINSGDFRISETSSTVISSAGGEPGNSGGEGGNSGGEGGNSGGEGINITFKEGHAHLFGKNYDWISSPVQFNNPFIERTYSPLIICGFKEYPCTQDEVSGLPIPYLIDTDKNNKVIPATAALVSRLAVENKLSLNSENNKFQIPNNQKSGIFLNQLRIQWSKETKLIRNYFKEKNGSWSFAQMYIPPRLILEALRKDDQDKYGFFEHQNLFSYRKENKRYDLNKAYVINRKKEEFSLFSDYTKTEPFSFKKENGKDLFGFRFMDYNTKTYIEVNLDQNGESATIKEYDLFDFSTVNKNITLQRSSLPEQLNWRFSETNSGSSKSKYNIIYVFDRDNLTELERIFIETPKTVFEVIYCQSGEQHCLI